MKLLIIGIDNCGCRLAAEFAELNRKAKSERRVEIITGAYAISNDQAILTSIASTGKDLRTLFVNRSMGGAEMTAEAGAELIREESGRIMTGIDPGDFYHTDAIMFIGGSAGNLGSVGVPILAQQLRERHVGKPIYALIVLPFEPEEANPNYTYNTAVCLKSTRKVTDAVFLFNNEKFKAKQNAPSPEDVAAINKEIVNPFYDLFCASEEVGPKLAGAKTLSIGDMLQTLSGWTAIGMGKTDFKMSRTFWKTVADFQEKGTETQKVMEAMNEAVAHLSIDFKLEDTSKALYLLSVPARGANVDMAKVLGNHLRELTSNAEIRGGDFYGARDCAQVTLVLSGLTYVDLIKTYYDEAVSLTGNAKKTKKSK